MKYTKDGKPMFRDELGFLSNFASCKIVYRGYTYGSVESAYQAQKTNNPELKAKFARMTAVEAKKASHSIPNEKSWEYLPDSFNVMLDLLRLKFTQSPFKEQLLATGDMELVENNDWYDTLWGVCNGKGKNHLGRLLMQVREELRSSRSIC